jgi:hypothetical protein
MKNFIRLIAIVAMAVSIQATFAQQPAAGDKGAPPPQATQTPEELDKQFARVQEQMTKMQQQMDRIGQAKDPKERQQLLQEHWTTMQAAMNTMHGMWGSGQMGCCGAGGHMMGGPMMWQDYRTLTPDQLKQRQYMMDRWMPMQQMMMDHMMQHQHWMMQPQQTAPK